MLMAHKPQLRFFLSVHVHPHIQIPSPAFPPDWHCYIHCFVFLKMQSDQCDPFGCAILLRKLSILEDTPPPNPSRCSDLWNEQSAQTVCAQHFSGKDANKGEAIFGFNHKLNIQLWVILFSSRGEAKKGTKKKKKGFK